MGEPTQTWRFQRQSGKMRYVGLSELIRRGKKSGLQREGMHPQEKWKEVMFGKQMFSGPQKQ